MAGWAPHWEALAEPSVHHRHFDSCVWICVWDWLWGSTLAGFGHLHDPLHQADVGGSAVVDPQVVGHGLLWGFWSKYCNWLRHLRPLRQPRTIFPHICDSRLRAFRSSLCTIDITIQHFAESLFLGLTEWTVETENRGKDAAPESAGSTEAKLLSTGKSLSGVATTVGAPKHDVGATSFSMYSKLPY